MELKPARRRSILTIAALVVAALAGVAFVVMHTFLTGGGETSEIPLDEIVRRYEASTPPPPSAPAPTPALRSTRAAPLTTASTAPRTTVEKPVSVLPAPGVYVYTTIGGDSVDALGGVSHDYPASTTITVTPADCGVLQRWDVVAERWEAWQRCLADGGVAETRRTTYDEFFDIGQTDTYECFGETRPVDASSAMSWSRTCRQGEREDVYAGTVVGVEQLEVGVMTVQALHVRVTIDNGREADRQVTDSWYQLGSDLVLAQSASNRTTNDTAFGEIHYVEEYEIRLTSFDPVS
jgi:hypothetical protein